LIFVKNFKAWVKSIRQQLFSQQFAPSFVFENDFCLSSPIKAKQLAIMLLMKINENISQK